MSCAGEFLVEGAAVDRLAEQLGDFSARVVDRLAQLDRPAVIGRRIVQQRPAIGIDLDLERDAELVAIAEHGLMMAGKPRRPRVPVQPLVELADLAGAVGHIERRAAPDGPVASAHAIAGFEHRAVVSGLTELIGRGQPGDAGAENDDLGAVTAARLERERFGEGGGPQKSHRLHGEIGGAIASGLRHLAQEFPTGAAHLDLALLLSVTEGTIRLPRSSRLRPARCPEVPPCRRRSGRACRSPHRTPRPSGRKIRSPPWAGRRSRRRN